MLNNFWSSSDILVLFNISIRLIFLLWFNIFNIILDALLGNITLLNSNCVIFVLLYKLVIILLKYSSLITLS